MIYMIYHWDILTHSKDEPVSPPAQSQTPSLPPHQDWGIS